MNKHKTKAKKEFDELYEDENENNMKFGTNEHWVVSQVDIQP